MFTTRLRLALKKERSHLDFSCPWITACRKCDTMGRDLFNQLWFPMPSHLTCGTAPMSDFKKNCNWKKMIAFICKYFQYSPICLFNFCMLWHTLCITGWAPESIGHYWGELKFVSILKSRSAYTHCGLYHPYFIQTNLHVLTDRLLLTTLLWSHTNSARNSETYKSIGYLVLINS